MSILILKNNTSNEESIWDFIQMLMKQLSLTVNKEQLKKRTVFL